MELGGLRKSGKVSFGLKGLQDMMASMKYMSYHSYRA